MTKKVCLETTNLNLRHLDATDATKIYEMSREEGMLKWIPDGVYQDEREAAEVISSLSQHYSNCIDPFKSPYVLGIELKATGALIGHVGLSTIKEGIEIGYAIAAKYQGFGFATETVQAITAWGLKELKLPAVLGVVDSRNTPSCSVLENSGYELIQEVERPAFGRHGMCRIYQREG